MASIIGEGVGCGDASGRMRECEHVCTCHTDAECVDMCVVLGIDTFVSH